MGTIFPEKIPSNVIEEIKAGAKQEFPDDKQCQLEFIAETVSKHEEAQQLLENIPKDVVKKIESGAKEQWPDHYQWQLDVIIETVNKHEKVQQLLENIPKDVVKKIESGAKEQWPDHYQWQLDVINTELEELTDNKDNSIQVTSPQIDNQSEKNEHTRSDSKLKESFIDLGIPTVTTRQLTELKENGITLDYTQAIVDSLSSYPTVNQLLKLKKEGITVDFVQGVVDSLSSYPTVDQLIKLQKKRNYCRFCTRSS